MMKSVMKQKSSLVATLWMIIVTVIVIGMENLAVEVPLTADAVHASGSKITINDKLTDYLAVQ
jgi:hypothetical protein